MPEYRDERMNNEQNEISIIIYVYFETHYQTRHDASTITNGLRGVFGDSQVYLQLV